CWYLGTKYKSACHLRANQSHFCSEYTLPRDNPLTPPHFDRVTKRISRTLIRTTFLKVVGHNAGVQEVIEAMMGVQHFHPRDSYITRRDMNSLRCIGRLSTTGVGRDYIKNCCGDPGAFDGFL